MAKFPPINILSNKIMIFDLNSERYEQFCKTIIRQYKESKDDFLTWKDNQNDVGVNRRILSCARYYFKQYCRPYINLVQNKFDETIENGIFFDLYDWTEIKKKFKFLSDEEKTFANYLITSATLSNLTNVYDIFASKSTRKCIVEELKISIKEAKQKADEVAIKTFAHYVEKKK